MVNALRWERCHQMLMFIWCNFTWQNKQKKRKSGHEHKIFLWDEKISHAHLIFIVYIHRVETVLLQRSNSCTAPKAVWVFPLVIIYSCKVWHINLSRSYILWAWKKKQTFKMLWAHKHINASVKDVCVCEAVKEKMIHYYIKVQVCLFKPEQKQQFLSIICR